MRTLRVLIIDDEPLAREGLRLRLMREPGITIVAECGTAAAAREAMARHHPDLLLLDIEMPHDDGFSILPKIASDELPAVIFVTAHAQYAAHAFRAHAVDYLLKPVDDAALRDAILRARRYIQQAGQRPMRSTITVREEQRTIVLPTTEIDWIESAGDYVQVHAGAKVYRLRQTMRETAAQLDASFVQVHRTAMVAISRIRELQPYSHHEHLVVLRDGTTVPLSRRMRPAVMAAIGGRIL